MSQKVKIAGVEIGIIAFFGGLATLCLVGIELQRLTMLDVPVSIAFTGFDVVASALGNIGLLLLLTLCGIVAIAGIIALFTTLIVGGWVLVFVFCFIAFWFRYGLVTTTVTFERVSPHLKNVLHDIGPKDGTFSIKKLSEEEAEGVFAGLLKRRQDARDQLDSELKTVFHRALGVWRKLLNCIAILWVTFSDLTSSPPYARLLRSAALAFTAVFVALAGALIVEHQINAMPTHQASPKPIEQNSNKWITSAQKRITNSRFSNWPLFQKIGGLVAPKPMAGYLTFSKNYSKTASHLEPFAKSDSTSFQRSEQIYYIGDFGDWAFVARYIDPSQRVMIRRSTLAEFGHFAASKEKQATVTTLSPEEKTTLGEIGQDQARIKQALSQIAIDQEAQDQQIDLLIESTTAILAKEGQTTEQALTAFSDLVEAQARTLNGQLKIQSRHIEQLSKHASQVVTKLGDRGGSDTEKDADIVVLQQGFRIANERLDRQLSQIWKLSDRIDSLSRGPALDPSTFATELTLAIQEGLTTRTSSVLNDLQRVFGRDAHASCVDFGSYLQHVEFDEAKKQGSREDIEVLARQLSDRADPENPRLVMLRGGASYTGMPNANLSLSDARADWAKRMLLRALSEDDDDLSKLETIVEAKFGLQIVAFGVGERLPRPGRTARSLDAILCPPSPAISQPNLLTLIKEKP